MTKRDVVKIVLDHGTPPWVPWSFKFTVEAEERLVAHYETSDIDAAVQNHIVRVGADVGFFTDLGNDCLEDVFGVVWDRSVDKDIGVVRNTVLPDPSLKGYRFPDPRDPRFFDNIDDVFARKPDLFRVFELGFSLYERAWTMRGMERLFIDFYDNPGFVHDLFSAIVDYNVAQVEKALTYDIDAVYFGDDWGAQRGLQMGPELWREFILPHLKRMYGVVRKAGKYVMIHSCGDVDELFDDLIDAGVQCFNPFQPEVMDVFSLLPQYRSRLSFHGGLSTQRTLPYGNVDDVVKETNRLITLGRDGGYICSPAHAVEGDVPLDNMLAFIDAVQKQTGYKS